MTDKRAIVIVGAGRSGTSFLCQLLADMGVPFGEPLVEADHHNERGYFERADIKALRYEWLEWAASIKPEAATQQKRIKDELKQIIADQLDKGPLWGLKDAGEHCFVHVLKDIFDELDVEVKYLLAIRDPASMYASVREMLGPNDPVWTLEQVIQAWDAYYVEILSHVQALPVSFEDWFNSDGQLKQMKHVSNHCALVGFADFNKLIDEKLVHQFRISDPPPALYGELRQMALEGDLATRLGKEPEIKNAGRWRMPLLIGTATLGQVRMEWHNAVKFMTIPVNLSYTDMIQPYQHISPMSYHVAEAQNIIVHHALSNPRTEWVFLLEDDVIPPSNVLLQWAKWMHDGRFPVVSGWYNVKSNPPEPMFFRGRGNGPVCYTVNEVADKTEWINEDMRLRGILCDGVPTGCILISTKLLRVIAEDSPIISVKRQAKEDGSLHEIRMREVFHTMRDAGFDPETDGYWKKLGTSDLEFCDRVIDEGYLKKAGYDYAAELEYPFPIDTDIRCGHIELSSGVTF